MNQVALADTGRRTTRLGFGCSSIMGALNRRESLAMLEAAVDAGITHFDVAPSYGYGQAEACLGDLLVRHPGRLTVTTKYGIPPPRAQSLVGLARGLVKPVLKRIPGLKQRLAGVARTVVSQPERSSFSASQARASLEHSLAELKTDHLDLFLLHEATADDLDDQSLLRFLEDARTSGRIGAFGIGSQSSKIPRLLAERPAFCPTLQYEWSVLDAAIPAGPSFRIHHRSLTESFRSLHAALVGQPAVCRRWSEATGRDLASPDSLAHLMLKASLVANPDSVILFSSKSPAHVRANVEVAEDILLEGPARRLHELVQAEGAALTEASTSHV